MTQSIERGTQRRAGQLQVPETVTTRHRPLIIGIGCFTAVTAAGGIAFSVATLTGSSWRVALVGATLLMLAGIGAAVLCLHNMIADREDFYRRGHLDGWMRGWHNQDPDGDSPLLK